MSETNRRDTSDELVEGKVFDGYQKVEEKKK
jgi:hypothetical protein